MTINLVCAVAAAGALLWAGWERAARRDREHRLAVADQALEATLRSLARRRRQAGAGWDLWRTAEVPQPVAADESAFRLDPPRAEPRPAKHFRSAAGGHVGLDAVAFPDPPAPPERLVHASPVGDGRTGCCGRVPFELPATDRVTVYLDRVTCPGAGLYPQMAAVA